MADNLETLLSETRKRLGRDDIFNTPPGTIANDHIAQLRKRLMGQVEPEKQTTLPKSLERPKPEKHVTFPEFAGAMVQELGAGYFKGLLSPVSSFLNVKAQLNPSDVERLRTIRSYVRRNDIQDLIANPLGQAALEMSATHAADVAEVGGTITSFIPAIRAAKLGLRAGAAAVGATEAGIATAGAWTRGSLAMEKALRAGKTAEHAGVAAARVERLAAAQPRMTWAKALEQTYSPSQRRVLQLAAENVTATTMFEAAMELDDGEDRLSRIAFDSGLGFLTEGITSARAVLRSGVREELGRTAYRALTREVPEGVIERVRAGVATIEEAEAVLNVAKKHPSVASTPSGAPTTVVAQARKVQEAIWEHILPKPGNMGVDPQMALDLQAGLRPGVKYKIRIDDQIIEDHIPTGKTQEEAAKFGKKLVAVRDRVHELVAEGKNVRITEIKAGDDRSIKRFTNFFLGKTSVRRLTGEGPLPKVPNSSGPETAAVQGRPSEGAKVQIRTREGIEHVEVVANPNASADTARRKAAMDRHLATYGNRPRPAPVSEEPSPDASLFGGEPDEPVTVFSSGGTTPFTPYAAERVYTQEESLQRWVKSYTSSTGKPPSQEAIDVHRQRIADHYAQRTNYGHVERYQGRRDAPPQTGGGSSSGSTEVATEVTSTSPLPSPGPPQQPRSQTGTVWVKGANGKVRPVDLRDITVAVPLPRKQLKLNNHESGAENRFMVHVGEKRTEFESIAAPLEGDANFFRSEFFDEIDPTGDYHESVRAGFKDGKLTLSAPMVYEEYVPTMTGPALRESIPGEGANVSAHYGDKRSGAHFIGTPKPGDVEHTLLGRVAPEFESRYVPGKGMVENRYKPLRDSLPPLERGRIPAGYDPISDTNPPVRLRRQKVVGETEPVLDEDEFVEGADELGYSDADPSDMPSIMSDTRVVPAGGYLSKELGPSNPAFVTLQKAAKILKDQGLDGGTPVSLHTSNTRYSVTPDDAPWTVDDIINTELPLPTWRHMQAQADVRGLKVRPEGKGAVVSTMDGQEYRFANQMEAYEAVARIPVNKVGPKLEADIEKALGFGSERMYDADVDVDTFRPRRVQSLAMQELVQGARPAITVQTRNPEAVRAAVKAVEKQAGLKPGTYQIYKTFSGTDKRAGVVIYEPNRVKQAVAPVAKFLDRQLGIRVTPDTTPEWIIAQLAKKPQGLGIVAGRDPHSAAVYTWMRTKGLKEEWRQGKLEADALGPYRTYPEAPQLTQNIGGGADNFPDANGKDLEDLLSLPSGMGAAFTPPPRPQSPEVTPEMIDEFAAFKARQLRGESQLADEGGGIGSQLWSWLAVPMRHWQKRQSETGVPFFDWWETMNLARKNVEVTLNDLLAENRRITKAFSRDDRIMGTQLFEAKMAGTGHDDMAARASEGAKKYADSYEAMQRRFYKEQIGIDDESFEYFWGSEVSTIRKSDGNYTAYLQRNPIPGPSRTIHNQLKTGEVMFDQREWDGSIIAKRVARAFAHEKHLVPAHSQVAATFKAYVNSERVAQPDYMMFLRYMNEAMHRPDEVQLALSYGVHKTVNAIVKRFPGAKHYLSEADSINVVDMFSTVNTLSNMGFQPGMVLRNFIGGAQMVYMRAPAKEATEALSEAAKALKNPVQRAWLEQRGVIMRDPVSQSVAQIGEAVRQLEGGRVLGTVGTGFSKMLETGMSAYKTADDVTRVWAYLTQHKVSTRLAKELEAGKITIDGFIDQGQIDMLGPIVERNTRNYLAQGRYDEAVHYTSTYFKDLTQFQYERGNTPRVLQSTLGRLFGQYGTWPLSYLDTLKNLVSGPGSKKNRYTTMAKWAAIHTATFTTMSSVFGVDFTRWSYLAPMGYKGGPFLELADQATSVLKATVSGEEDAAARIEAARLKQGVVGQLTPLPWGAMRTARKSIDSAMEGDWPSFMRAVLSMPEVK
jgi:hypothetical protein